MSNFCCSIIEDLSSTITNEGDLKNPFFFRVIKYSEVANNGTIITIMVTLLDVLFEKYDCMDFSIIKMSNTGRYNTRYTF